jgi:hypothetical protein
LLTGIRKFALATDAWTDIVTPFPCSYFLIIGCEDSAGNRIDQPLIRCSDKNSVPSTQYTMKTGDWFALVANARFGAYRYQQGDPVTFLKCTSPPCTAIVEFFQ